MVGAGKGSGKSVVEGNTMPDGLSVSTWPPIVVVSGGVPGAKTYVSAPRTAELA